MPINWLPIPNPSHIDPCKDITPISYIGIQQVKHNNGRHILVLALYEVINLVSPEDLPGGTTEEWGFD